MSFAAASATRPEQDGEHTPTRETHGATVPGRATSASNAGLTNTSAARTGHGPSGIHRPVTTARTGPPHAGHRADHPSERNHAAGSTPAGRSQLIASSRPEGMPAK